MEYELEYEDFSKTTPSLIGSSIRDSSDIIPTMRSFGSEISPKRSDFVKKDHKEVDVVNVDEIKKEGGLVADEDGEKLDDILDNNGHIKDDVIPETERAKHESSTLSSPPITATELERLNTEENIIDDSNKVTILGGDAAQYLAPAGGASSGYKYPLKKKKGKDSEHLEEVSKSSASFIEPDHMRSVDDIINVVNKGDFERASTLIDDKVAESISSTNKKLSMTSLKDHDEPVVPDMTVENDSHFVAPAAMREGSESRLLEEQRSRSLSRNSARSPDSVSNPLRPNLARGDSIHSGLHDDLRITNTFDKSSQSLVSERRPRHDPAGSIISNSSSLSYLRSISRSRSRMANDRKNLGVDDPLNSEDLRQSGALINDDSMSNRSDIEYAVNKALDFVEDTHTVKNGKRLSASGDIVENLQKGLAEVAEEEEASNRKTVNSTDLLDQLADSAKELMLDGDDDDLIEEENEDNLDVSTATEEKTAEVVDAETTITKTTETETEGEKGEDNVDDKADNKEAIDVPEEKNDVTRGQADIESDKKENVSKNEVPADSKEVAEEETKETELNKEISKEVEPASTTEVNDIEKTTENDNTKDTDEQPKTSEPETSISKEVETDELPTESTPTTESKNDDNIDSLIAAARREKALNESHNNPMGTDGSVYVPKVAKMEFEDEPVYLYTSLAGGFHVTTRTNRLVTILTANRIKFEYRDLGTDEEAKKVWRRYSGGKTLPGIVRGKDDYIGNWEDIEEANEDYRVRSLIYETI